MLQRPRFSALVYEFEFVEIHGCFLCREEGVVLKDLDSKWDPSDRSGKWLKLKPDYIHSESDLDALIIGKYVVNKNLFLWIILQYLKLSWKSVFKVWFGIPHYCVNRTAHAYLTTFTKMLVHLAELICNKLLLTKTVFITNSLRCLQVVIMDPDGVVVRLVTSCSLPICSSNVP